MLSFIFVGRTDTGYSVPLFATVSKFAGDGLFAIGLLKLVAAEFRHCAVLLPFGQSEMTSKISYHLVRVISWL